MFFWIDPVNKIGVFFIGSVSLTEKQMMVYLWSSVRQRELEDPLVCDSVDVVKMGLCVF